MMDTPPKDQLTDHEYDGIREYDNPTPGWWWWLFIVTIVFSPIYFFVVLAAQGVLSPEGEFKRAEIAAAQKLFGDLAMTPDEATILGYAQDDRFMGVAQNIFLGKCATCHGADGQGMSGANLTDDLYINVKSAVDIYDVIAEGRNNNAMPAWKTQLSVNEMVLMSSYVTTLRGKNLPGRAPDPQAMPIDPWPEAEPLPKPEGDDAPAEGGQAAAAG